MPPGLRIQEGRTIAGQIGRESSLLLPPLFQRRMSDLLEDEYPAFLASLGRPAQAALRANTLKVTLEPLLALLGLPAAPLPWCPEGSLLPPDTHLGQHPLHAAGLFYLQEPGAMAAVPLLDPRPGERILDLCAAPGGKATHIAARLCGQGLLWANEIHPVRARILLANLERWGARNAVVSVERPDRLAERLPGFFDRVLVDAPCSGEGLFRRDAEAARSWGAEAVAGCARRQQHILEQAARLVRPGGLLLYATCTFAPEEDEQVVGCFLAAHPGFSLEEGPAWPGSAPGRPEWSGNLPPAIRAHLPRAVRLWPHRAPGEGHFLARLRRQEGERSGPSPRWRAPRLAGPALRAYESFCAAALHRLPSTGEYLHGEHLFALPAEMPDPAGLRFLRPGWLLGEVHRDRFIPSHALAMALDAAAFQQCLDLAPQSEESLAFLRGEPLRSAGQAGWLLVTVAGFPLGWGKRVGAVVKNHRPRERA